MPHEWNYVGVGYGVALIVLATYVGWMLRRTRRLRRTLGGDSDG
jgi:hypothetical protein